MQGINLVHTLSGHSNCVSGLSWSPDGSMLASGSGDNTICLWDATTGKLQRRLVGQNVGVSCIAWSPDGSIIASGSLDGCLRLWDSRTGAKLGPWEVVPATSSIAMKKNEKSDPWLPIRDEPPWTSEGKVHGAMVWSVRWSRNGQRLAAATSEYTVWVWDVIRGEFARHVAPSNSFVFCLAWSPDDTLLAGGSGDSKIYLWDLSKGLLYRTLEGHLRDVLSLAWSHDGQWIASGSKDSTIRIWEAQTGRLMTVLEGHTASVNTVAFSSNGLIIASKSEDGTLRLWDCHHWEPITTFDESTAPNQLGVLDFHPFQLVLASADDSSRTIRVNKVDYPSLLRESKGLRTIKYTSAKIVLVGESNVGKSCLAMRLAEDRYPGDDEQGTTHGMRFWQMKPENLSASAMPSEGERRDIVLWDMGGQDEYRLVHQLFLHDTTVALVLLDPTRGRTAFQEVEAWNRRLEKQLRDRKTEKILVGSKMDKPSTVVDTKGLEHIVCSCCFQKYCEISAKNGRNIAQLRESIAELLDWDKFAKTTRPELFQYIRDEIERHQDRGEVVLSVSDLERSVLDQHPQLYEVQAVHAVAEQLAAQGLIAQSKLASGECALVLQVGEIERYAGSLIVAARENPRGIAALEKKIIASPKVPLHGISDTDRLPRVQERAVLECVTELLIDHGICFEHEGLLVFPSLFRATEHENEAYLPHAISLYYDFSGSIDNIYASLVASLVITDTFGRIKMWENRVEFESTEHGACGLRRVDREGGFAHLDIYFSEATSQPRRSLFITFVEDHLNQHGIDIIEHIAITCTCGYCHEEQTIRTRISIGSKDIGCPRCDARTLITDGATKAHQRSPELKQKVFALKTEMEEKRRRIIERATDEFRKSDEESCRERPIFILHLSDLHFGDGEDIEAKYQPLVADLRDKNGGLGLQKLDHLVISGDLTKRATPKQFELAYKFISKLISDFELTAERIIVVPGNHDLSWDEEVYKWVPKRKLDEKTLENGSFCRQGDGFLVRDDEKYPLRFKNFSQWLYHPLSQTQYPQTEKDQCISYLFPSTRIQYITLNSSWEIDEWFQTRVSVNDGALSRALSKADKEVKDQLTDNISVLRIAVLHHPVNGEDRLNNDALLERLRKADVKVLLHGHIHENRVELIGYLHDRKIHVAGAGSFGAAKQDRSESMPRLYNLLEISGDLSRLKVHTRCLPKEKGAWEGWAVWPGDNVTERRTYYTVEISSL